MRLSLFLSVALLLVAGCDTEGDEMITFQNVALESRGDATLAVESDGSLVVSGIGPGRSGGFTLPGAATRVDVEIDPLSIPAGARFGIEVEDENGEDLASFYNVGSSSGEVDFVFDFPSSLGVEAAVVTYRIGGESGNVVFEGFLDLALTRQSVARLAPTGAGKGSGDTGSTHVIRENGRYIVVSDSDEGNARRGCAGFFATPPVTLDFPNPEPVCTDWIEVEPLLETEMPEGEVSVTGASVGSFTVRELQKR